MTSRYNCEKIIETKVTKRVTHKVKPGEVLGGIADKYNVSLKALKKANGLKSDMIRDGKTLTIPSKKTQPRFVTKTTFLPIDLNTKLLSHDYFSDKTLDKITIIANQNTNDYALNGLILENNSNIINLQIMSIIFKLNLYIIAICLYFFFLDLPPLFILKCILYNHLILFVEVLLIYFYNHYLILYKRI